MDEFRIGPPVDVDAGAVAAAQQDTGGGVPQSVAVDDAAGGDLSGGSAFGVVEGDRFLRLLHRSILRRLGSVHALV
jgi:hypothetical protein